MTADDITARLTTFWVGTKQLNLAELERYYYGTQSLSDNGMFTTDQMGKPDLTRFFRPVNYCAAIIDEPVGYLTSGRVRITSENPRAQAWAESYYNRRIRPRFDDLVRWQGLYGEAFGYFWTDRQGISRGLKMDVLAPVEGGNRRVAADYGGMDSEELTRAVIYRRHALDTTGRMEEYRITLTPDRIVVEKREVNTQSGADLPKAWQLVSDDENPANALPLVPFFNPTPSDILNFIPIQDDLDKLRVDIRLAREYYGQPAWATDAMDVPQDVEVGAGRILYGGNFQLFPPPALKPLLDERDMLLEDGAKTAKSLVLLSEMGQAPSGIALQYRQQSFQEKLAGKAQRLATGSELALTTAARLLAHDPEMYELETRALEPQDVPSAAELGTAEFGVTIEPNIPADEEANTRIASMWVNDLGASRKTALGKAGIEDPEAELERALEERESEWSPPSFVPGELTEDA